MADIEKKSTYNYEAQKKYNENSKHIGLKFIENEIDFYNQIETACNEKNMSKQKYIKVAIMEKLKRDGFLSEWDVVLNTMCDSVDNFILQCG